MANIKKDLGICIRAVDYSDTSQVLTFFCREAGKISVMARGSKRKNSKFGGPVEILSFGQLLFSKSPMATLAGLREFEPKPNFIALRKSLVSINCAMFAAELTGLFTEDYHSQPELFDQICQLFGELQLSTDKKNMVASLIRFQLSLLEHCGLGLVLDRCVNCSSSKYLGPFISSQANGFICFDCQMSYVDKIQLSKQAVQVLSDIQQMANTSADIIYEIERVLTAYFRQITNRQLKMSNYFLQLS